VLTEFISNDERIVLIEDTAEIQIHKENVLRFDARQQQNGLAVVTIRDLLKATLRHRPDRIIVGEIRGGEAFDLLQLLNNRAQRNYLERPCRFCGSGRFPLHDLRAAEQRGAPLSRHQEKYCRIAKRHHSPGVAPWMSHRDRSS